MEESKKELGKRIKVKRVEKGMTQTDLAKKAKVAIATLCYLEQGKKVPKKELLERIERALD